MQQGFLTQRFQEETRRSMDEADQAARAARSDLLRLDAEESDLVGRRISRCSRRSRTSTMRDAMSMS